MLDYIMDLSLPIILSTFVIIFIAELPDKTALAALVLATKYRASQVILGAWLAFVVQTVVAVAAGSVLTLLPEQPIRIAAGLGFLIFAYFAYIRKEEQVEHEEEVEVSRAKKNRPVWITSFLVLFAAEWGDLTQLATAGLVAHQGHGLSVGIGAILALWSVTLVAVFAGSQLNKIISPERLNTLSAVLFGLIGIFIIVTAVV
jgi:putative Ca2+/H+ antiporter (TMEM165/GDT1 family)